MRIVNFEYCGQRGLGIVRDGGLVNCAQQMIGDHGSLRSVLASEEGLERLRAFEHASPDMAIADVRLLPPVPDPERIICVGINYAGHVRETGRPMPERPMLFLRLAGSQVGDGEPILVPPESEQLDFEGELAVVIGKAGRRIPRGHALDHVAGYSCYNDGSIRDWQRHSVQFTAGKNFVGTGAFGPWLVSADEVGDPSRLALTTRLNGQVMQSASLSDLIFDVPALIEYCSTFTELSPGDVIVTGTPGGVGAFRTPPVWMRPGDIVEVEIAGVGTLRNPIAAEPRQRAA